MENFCWEWDVLRDMTAHVDTGEPLPRELFDRMLAAKNFQSGLATRAPARVRRCSTCCCTRDVRARRRAGVRDRRRRCSTRCAREVAVVPRAPYDRFMHAFGHVFAGGYAAGYYSYKWAEVLSADAFSLFEELGVLYRVVRALLALGPQDSANTDARLPTQSVRICRACGAGHFDDQASLCHGCDAPLGDAEIVNHVFRIENVATQPAERITANDEERQRQGFELQTTFEWAVRDHVLDVRHRRGDRRRRCDRPPRLRSRRDHHATEQGPATARQSHAARLPDRPRLRLLGKERGRGRRADGSDGIAAAVDRAERAGSQERPSASSPPTGQLSQTALATVQHALLRGIEAVFQLEEGEILAEPMPNRDARSGFLLYEATEGGAGVLTRLVGEPDRLAEVACKALAIMHFDVEASRASRPMPGTARRCPDTPVWPPATAA